MARVKSCFVKRKQLLERFKEGKEDHVVSPPFFLSFFFSFFFLNFLSSFSRSFFFFSSLPSSGPVFLEVDGVACCVVSGACLQFLWIKHHACFNQPIPSPLSLLFISSSPVHEDPGLFFALVRGERVPSSSHRPLFDNSSSFENSFESESKGQQDSLSFLRARYPSRDMSLYKFVINSCTDFFYVFPRLSGSRALVRDWRMLFLFFLIINLIVEKCGGDVT